jgi:hypothetical protein
MYTRQTDNCSFITCHYTNMTSKNTYPTTTRMQPALSQPYFALFMVIEVHPSFFFHTVQTIAHTHQPGVIVAALLSMVFDPDSHLQSMGPDRCSDTSYETAAGLIPGQSSHECMLPRIRALQYYFMAALAFSAFVEPAVLYVATYKLRDARDSQTVVRAVLASFAAFDIFHAVAAIAGSSFHAALPMAAEFDVYVAINFWIPLTWLVVRGTWFLGNGTKDKEL